MLHRDFETPLLTTGGIMTAIYQFAQGDLFNLFLGTSVTISVVILNIYKIRKYIREEKNEKNI
tara:strand:- start:527 stop:715 length:189 start_codon:yes stop_codon:yes gene_type:complete